MNFNRINIWLVIVTTTITFGYCSYSYFEKGTASGNGCCYVNGRYCGLAKDGNGNTLGSGKECDCGLSSMYGGPSVLDGVEIFPRGTAGENLIKQIQLPKNRAPLVVEMWTGRAFVPFKNVEGGSLLDFPEPGAMGLRITGIQVGPELDPSSMKVFPIKLLGRSQANLEVTSRSISSKQALSGRVSKAGSASKLVIIGGLGPFQVLAAPANNGPWRQLSISNSREVPINGGTDAFLKIVSLTNRAVSQTSNRSAQ